MKIHILGICGTFMGSLAVLAKRMGHDVSGSDMNVYPPMSTLLESEGIDIVSGYSSETLEKLQPDEVIVGNAISRGNPALEFVLEHKLPFDSGPSWMRRNILSQKRVVAVAGTHGKTTTTSMVAHILDVSGLNPCFLIGGVANNFTESARLTDSDIFVIEADEYDTSFFDKRAKFVHFFPEIAIVNNLEFDHADIYENLDAIVTQFHQMVRTIPQTGYLICAEKSAAMQQLVEKGVWCAVDYLEDKWKITRQGNAYAITNTKVSKLLPATIVGRHNAANALAALNACMRLGVKLEEGLEALRSFKGVKRRLELIYEDDSIQVYDDFAHHPTAVKATLETVRNLSEDGGRILVVLEFGSRSMQLGVHKEALQAALDLADGVYCEAQNNLQWSLQDDWKSLGDKLRVSNDKSSMIDNLLQHSKKGDRVLILRNTGFGGFDKMLLSALDRQVA